MTTQAANLIFASHPPPIPEIVERALRETLTTNRDAERQPLLRRALTGEERAALTARVANLQPFVDPGSLRQKAEEITAMLSGMGGRWLSVDDARVTSGQYLRTCADLPLWAVARAGQRFATGQVHPEEVGQKRPLDLNAPPTTAQLYVVAAAIAKPVMEERYRISTALRGVLGLTARKMTDEEREAEAVKIRARAADFMEGRNMVAEVEAVERTGKMVISAREAREQNARFIEREYRAAGLDVPPWKGDMPPASLSLMLSVGYRIGEDSHGKKILIGPANLPPIEHRQRAPAKADAMDDEIPF